MVTYYAIFYRLESGGFGVRFPDMSSIHTSGQDLDEALAMAIDALSGMLVVGRKGREYTAPSGYDAVKEQAAEGELVFPVVPSEAAMEEYRPKKRVNVMVPVDLLTRIDEHVKTTAGMDRSRFFSEAAERRLHGPDW
jgi:predicted RNase H-like HicB family nuclease